MGPAGLEPGSVSNCDTNDLAIFRHPCAAKSGALFTETDQIDPDLQQIIDAWDALPERITSAILELAQSVKTEEGKSNE